MRMRYLLWRVSYSEHVSPRVTHLLSLMRPPFTLFLTTALCPILSTFVAASVS